MSDERGVGNGRRWRVTGLLFLVGLWVASLVNLAAAVAHIH